jgi:hypothetical protein
MRTFEGGVVGADMVPLVGRCCILPVLPLERPPLSFGNLLDFRMFNKIHESPPVNFFFYMYISKSR